MVHVVVISFVFGFVLDVLQGVLGRTICPVAGRFTNTSRVIDIARACATPAPCSVVFTGSGAGVTFWGSRSLA